MRIWNVNQVEIIPMRVESEEYNQVLDEVSEMIYRYFCQLYEIDSLVPETQAVTTAGRTGTDG